MIKNITPVATAITLSLLAGAQARAQDSGLEEIIVTATKRAENLQDVPVTVNAIGDATLQAAGVVDLLDITRLVPTLSVSSNLSPFNTGIRVRGIGTAQNDPSLEASVAVIIDGVYMNRSGLGMSDLTDIERIEVLQGPQGTLYGKNSNAGVISIVTRKPDFDETGGYVEATAGDYGLEQYTGSVTGPLSDTFAYRLSGSWRQEDGWLENGTGPDEGSAEDWNMRGKLEWLPTEDLSVLLTASHVDRDDRCCGADALQTPAVLHELQAQGMPLPENDAFDWRNNLDRNSDFTMNSDTAVVTIDYDLDWAQLTSVSAWNDYSYKTSTDADRSQLDIMYVVDDRYDGNSMSQEFRLASNLDGPLQYLAGLYYVELENTRGNGSPFVFLGEDFLTVAVSQLSPAIALIAQPGDWIGGSNEWKSETVAAFGQTTYSFGEDWLLTLGLRYTGETKDADLFTTTFSSSLAQKLGIPTFMDRVGPPIDDSFNLEDNNATWMASVRYFLTGDTMIFAAAATGSKSGGFNGVSGGAADREFAEETTRNYELGIKSQLLDDRLKLNATAFYAEFDDLQFLAQNPTGVGTFVSNAAAVTTQGVDLSISARPLPNLMLDGGLQYLDAEYTKGTLEVLQVPFAPDWTGNLAATLLLPLADGVTYLRTDYSFMGDHYTNPANQPAGEQDSDMFNSRLGWRNDAWDASLWVKNITDQAYSNLVAAPFVPSGMLAEFLQAPRTYGATVRYSF